MTHLAVSSAPHLSFATTIAGSPACYLMWAAGLFILMQAAMGKATKYGWNGKGPVERFLMSAFAFMLVARGIGVFKLGSINLLSLGVAVSSFAWQGWALALMMVSSYRARRASAAAKAELERTIDTDPAASARYLPELSR